MSEENAQPSEGGEQPQDQPEAQANTAPEGASDANPAPPETKWQHFEMVDGQMQPVLPNLPAQGPTPSLGDPTYYVRHPDDTYSVADPQPVLLPLIAQQVLSTPQPIAPAAAVHLLDRARALPELAKEEAAHLVDEGIQAFKDIEGRTMNVVHRFGQLFKQEK